MNFKEDVTTTADNILVDKVTGNRLKEDESEQIWRFEVDDKSGASILTGELENGSDFAIAEVNENWSDSRDTLRSGESKSRDVLITFDHTFKNLIAGRGSNSRWTTTTTNLRPGEF